MAQGRFKCPSASPVTAFALGPTPREKVEGAHDAHGLHIPRLRICGEIELRHGVGAEVEAGQQGGPDPSPRHRDDRPGAKFATMDLIGLPNQVSVGPKGLGEGKVEIKNRRTGERESVSVEAAISRLGGIA